MQNPQLKNEKTLTILEESDEKWSIKLDLKPNQHSQALESTESLEIELRGFKTPYSRA